jgi:hypothetical protein
MTTYSTKITAMYTVNTPDPDYVVNVLFTVTGVDGDNTASIDGNVQFAQTTSDKAFIPYSSLTQTEVLAWIDTATDNLQNYYANIDGQIASMITPPVSPANTELPWVTAENAKIAEFNAKTFTI